MKDVIKAGGLGAFLAAVTANMNTEKIVIQGFGGIVKLTGVNFCKDIIKLIFIIY